ncbi:hypothetical protein B0H16DRAFT_1477149 [Mycena metata]|uniref:Uncharacterized protein n=1 Tax=Mycena metata TaxID=1033252 RepID=A0AAD7MG46_9AGAR|nr:hypothetical protein B0H16DRAFT_1477149 [Mycena metata]
MAPNPTASGPPRRSRKGSINGHRNNPDVGGDPIQGEPTPAFFGAVPVEPAPVNFSRDRKSSIGAVNMNKRFTVPALQAASRERVNGPSNRKPSAGGTKDNGLRSLASPPLEPTSLGKNTPESSRRMFNLFRTRKPSKADAPKINSPLAPAINQAAMQSSSSLVQVDSSKPPKKLSSKFPKFRRNWNRSTSSREDADHVPTAVNSSPSLVESTTSRKSLSIINFARSRTQSNTGKGNPLNGTPIDFRTRKAPDDNGLRTGAIGTSQASPKRSGRKNSFSLKSRPAEITSSTPASTRVPRSHTAPLNPCVLHDQPAQSAASGGVTMSSQGVKRESSFSFKSKSRETRKPSAPGPSAAQMEIYAPQNRVGASVANAKASDSILKSAGEATISAPRMEIYAPINRAGVSTASSNVFPVQPVKRKKSFGSKSNSTETRQPMGLVIPDIYAPKETEPHRRKLNPTATQMVKRKNPQNFKLPLTVSRASESVPSTALNAFAPLEIGAFDDLASAIVHCACNNPKTYPMQTLNPKMWMSNTGPVSQTLVPSNPFGLPKMTPAFTGPAYKIFEHNAAPEPA